MIGRVFFLLVFFMMASLSMNVSRGVSLSLPKAASGEPRQDRVSVSVTRDGVIYLDRDPGEPAQLTETLRALHEEDPEVAVVVSAHGDGPHPHLVDALDSAPVAG